ncbi:MAG: AlpA family phage regulatory protein [Acidobacteriota bacterium]
MTLVNRHVTSGHTEAAGIPCEEAGVLSPSPRRVLKQKEVSSRTSMSRSWIWRAVRAGTFPSPITLGSGHIGFFEDEIESWLATRPRVRTMNNVE